ncbi:hypothetical protein QL093DRAFT_2550616 [Fusarium oxysporum]|nr:hypothetical protein QL093DRAFT_2550616 [Fusarium oxysporum]
MHVPYHLGDKHYIPKSACRSLKPLTYSLNLLNPEHFHCDQTANYLTYTLQYARARSINIMVFALFATCSSITDATLAA